MARTFSTTARGRRAGFRPVISTSTPKLPHAFAYSPKTMQMQPQAKSPAVLTLARAARQPVSAHSTGVCACVSDSVGQEKPGAGAKSTCAFHSRSQPLRVGMRPGMYAVRAGGRFLWTGEDRGPGGKLANTTSCGHSPEGRLLRETNPRTPRDSVGIPAVQTL